MAIYYQTIPNLGKIGVHYADGGLRIFPAPETDDHRPITLTEAHYAKVAETLGVMGFISREQAGNEETRGVYRKTGSGALYNDVLLKEARALNPAWNDKGRVTVFFFDPPDGDVVKKILESYFGSPNLDRFQHPAAQGILEADSDKRKAAQHKAMGDANRRTVVLPAFDKAREEANIRRNTLNNTIKIDDVAKSAAGAAELLKYTFLIREPQPNGEVKEKVVIMFNQVNPAGLITTLRKALDDIAKKVNPGPETPGALTKSYDSMGFGPQIREAVDGFVAAGASAVPQWQMLFLTPEQEKAPASRRITKYSNVDILEPSEKVQAALKAYIPHGNVIDINTRSRGGERY